MMARFKLWHLLLLAVVIGAVLSASTVKADVGFQFQPVGGGGVGFGLRGLDEGKTWNTFFLGSSVMQIDSTVGVYAVYRNETLNEHEDGGDGAKLIGAWRNFMWHGGWWTADLGFLQDIEYTEHGVRTSGLTFAMGYLHEVGKGFHLMVYFERVNRGVGGWSTNLFVGFVLDAPFRFRPER